MYNYILMALFVFIFVSCTGSGPAVQPSRLMYNITLGEAGGVTGMSEGHVIDTSGVIYKFRGRTTAAAIKEEAGFLTLQAAAEINTLIPTIEDIEFRQSGNMYKFIILQRENKPDLHFAWSGMSKDPPEELDHFYHTITEIINKHKSRAK
jgi:hypothetical protein